MGSPIADRGTKAQVISCTAAYFRLEGAEKSPQSKKSCKNGGIFVFDGPIVAIGQIQQRARPSKADPAKSTRGPGDGAKADSMKDIQASATTASRADPMKDMRDPTAPNGTDPMKSVRGPATTTGQNLRKRDLGHRDMGQGDLCHRDMSKEHTP